MRAKFASAKLVLGGRIPSSKAFIHCREQYKNSTIKKDNSKLVFVDLHNSSFFDVDAVKNCIPISKPLINRTKDTIALGKWALWILDRKGYAGEIYCEDCGSAIKCPCCGGTMRWKSKKNLLSCIVCGKTQPIPSSCPSCGGPFLEGVRPGLEALAMEAKKRFVNITKSVILFENDGEKVPSPDILIKENPNGALLIGTRKLLALTDKLDVDLIGWVDADGEARIAEYDAKLRAFCLIFESLWRGLSPESRTVLIQSRAPSKNWQASLGLGWNSFWKHEIEEREKWELPPFFPMIKVTIPKYCVNKFVEDLDKQFFDFWQSEENDCELWIRTKKFEKLYSLFSSYFEIKNVKRGFPDITLFLD